MANWRERTYCGEINLGHDGQSVVISGWVDTVRDHGHLLFIHLRDIKGLIQVVFDPTVATDMVVARSLRSEFVVTVSGVVRRRADDTVNSKLLTGEWEVVAHHMEILNKALTPPFAISDKEVDGAVCVDEDLRLRYRYLDIRRPSVQSSLVTRHAILQEVRRFLSDHQFIEVDTPVLTKSTPEGARDYLVPSRVHQGSFYALPQSPQLFKQLLMVGGLDRYFQITKCFRDEDLRPNRQPEFTQIDLEASFIDEEFIMQLVEGLLHRVFAVRGIELPSPFPRLTYADSMNRYGNDHPDLRFGLPMIDVTETVRSVNYNIFKTIISSGGRIKGINVKGQSDKLSKNVLQEEFAKKVVPSLGAKGMTWMRVENNQLVSNIVQFFTDSEQSALRQVMQAEDGDVLMFIADSSPRLVNDVLGRFRCYVADFLGIIPSDVVAPCWVTDFPLFELIDGQLSAMHHPFTQPSGTIDSGMNRDTLASVSARAYDVVINGVEIGGGSIRIHSPEQQTTIFEILGLSESDIRQKFGFFIDAFKYGAPPHGGLAIGLDRLVAMVLGTDSIRDVIAFPKNRMAVCPMTQAPDTVDPEQLSDLGVAVTVPVVR
ncbi:aspartate--tRNA ligase [bacterium]|nr:aspartate--tRNA ligase [bacterium]